MKIGRNEKGFTLIELMVVLIIIGILAAIAIPIMSKQTDKAKVKRAVFEMKSMKTIIDTYYAENGECPSADNTANTPGNIRTELSNNGVNWTGEADGIVDPWGNPYNYTTNETKTEYKLICSGPSGNICGILEDDDEKDDIVATNKNNPTENRGNLDDDPNSSLYKEADGDEIIVISMGTGEDAD